jgi:multidrug efflux pump subunit AcrB
MKQKRKMFTALVLSIILAASALIPTETVKADSVPDISYGKTMTVSTGGNGEYYCDMSDVVDNIKNVKVKSSNTKVIYIGAMGGDTITGFVFSAKKAGKANLTIKVILKSGKTKTYKAKVTAVSYSNPLKSLKIGSKEIASRFKKDQYASYNTKAESQKVSVKLNSGWTLKSIQHTYYEVIPAEDSSGDSSELDETIEEKTEKVKNGGKMSCSDNKGSLIITAYNKKTKLTETLTVYINL